MADGPQTSFIYKLKNASASKKVTAAGGGLSAAALIYISSVYATRVDVNKLRASQTAQWQQISQINNDLNQIKGRNAAYEMLLHYITTGEIRYSNAPTVMTNSSPVK